MIKEITGLLAAVAMLSAVSCSNKEAATNSPKPVVVSSVLLTDEALREALKNTCVQITANEDSKGKQTNHTLKIASGKCPENNAVVKEDTVKLAVVLDEKQFGSKSIDLSKNTVRIGTLYLAQDATRGSDAYALELYSVEYKRDEKQNLSEIIVVKAEEAKKPAVEAPAPALDKAEPAPATPKPAADESKPAIAEPDEESAE